jgi:hypothetical protein
MRPFIHNNHNKFKTMKKAFRQTIAAVYSTILLGTCLLSISPVSEVCAQNCKPDKSVNDKFTRQKYDSYNYDLKGTWNVFSDVSTATVFSFVVVADTQIVAWLNYKQTASKNQRDMQPIRISKGNELYLANDAASVKLICASDAISKSKTDIISGNISQTFNAEYVLPIADLETFSQQVFDQVLINLDGTPGQKANIKKKDAEKMEADAKCLLAKFKKP